MNTVGYVSSGDVDNDLNNAPSRFGDKFISIGCNGSTANQPPGMTYAYVFHFGNSNSGIYMQIAFNDQFACYYRLKWNSWSSWKQI